MYRKPLTKFLIIIGSVCTAFVLVCCTIAFVRIFRASRETEKAQETLEAQREKMEEMEGTLKSAQKKVERAEKKRLKEETGNTIEFMGVIKPELIGGFVLRIGNTRIDASYARQLREIRNQLIEKN